MTVDVDVTASALPTTDAPYLSWRSLPYDHAHAMETLQICGGFMGLWFLLFFVGCYYHPIPSYYEKKMSKYDKLIWRFRVINAYHGASSTLLSFYWHLTQFTTECSRRNSTYELIMLANTGAYLVMDTVFMIYEKFLDRGNLVHHLFGISVYYSIALLGHNYTYMAMHLLPGEFSNVAMHMREILKRMGMRYTKAYYTNDFIYYFEYLACRVFWIPSIYYFVFSCPTSNPIQLIIYPLHVIQSWYYCSNIPPMIVQRYKEYKKITSAGVKVDWIEPVDSEKLKKVGVTTYERYHT